MYDVAAVLCAAYESAVHSQTGEPIPVLFRMAAFVPVNIPICAGMLLAPSTVRELCCSVC